VQRGTSTNTYAGYARRLSLDSATRALTADVQAEIVRKQTEAFRQSAQRLANGLTLSLLQELEACTTQFVKATSNRNRLWQKIAYYGMLRSKLVSEPAIAPDIFVSREGADGWLRQSADANTPLAPADVIEVRLHATTSRPGER
jgi:hypothetical protein